MARDLVSDALALLVRTETSIPKREPIRAEQATDTHGPILAVKIGGSVIGDYWLVLSDNEPFDPGDGLTVYRPSEVRALKAKGYGSEALQAVNRAKVILDGIVK